jgi:hypothetical protein
MISRDTVGDAAANLLERRWFAAFKAASGVRAECEALLESMAITQAAWSQARVRLSELEALDEREERILARDSSEVMSAA